MSDVLLKYSIIYQSIRLPSIRHAAASCTVRVHKISEYKENFRDLEFSVTGVTTEEFFNMRLVNKKLLEDDSQNLPRILLLESKRKP